MGASLKRKGKSGIDKALRRIARSCSGHVVVAGLVKGKSSPDNIRHGYLNEFGHSGPVFGKGNASTPARPFMVQSIPFIKDNISPLLEGIDINNVRKELDGLGIAMSVGIQQSIDSQDFEPNAATTVELKGHSKILVDTGEMYGDIKHEVRKA